MEYNAQLSVVYGEDNEVLAIATGPSNARLIAEVLNNREGTDGMIARYGRAVEDLERKLSQALAQLRCVQNERDELRVDRDAARRWCNELEAQLYEIRKVTRGD